MFPKLTLQNSFPIYIAKSLNERGHFAIEVGGRPDHVHILFDYQPTELLPDLVRTIKVASNRYINNNHLSPFKVQWQRGYACFSVSCRDYNQTRNYIKNQKIHHSHISVREEIRNMFQMAGISYDEEYLFD